MNATPAPAPWYRHPWPWILISGPALVVVAGFATLFIAFSGADGVVSDDYYKRGLAINRTLAREARAQAIGLQAEVRLEPGRVVVRIASREAIPDRVRLTFAHPTRAGLDRAVVLARTPGGLYEAPLAALPPGRWRVILESGDWRWTSALDTRG